MTAEVQVNIFQGYRGLYLMFGLLYFHLQGQTAGKLACTENDIIFLIDTSESMIENDPYGKPYYYWHLAKNFTYKVIDNFDIWPDRTRVALVTFNSAVTKVTALSRDPDGYTSKEDTLHALATLQHEGGITKTAKALQFAWELLQNNNRANAKKVVVIVTDGLTSLQHTDGATIIDDGIPYFGSEHSVFAVAVSKYIDEEEMQYYASDPPVKHILHLEDQSNMNVITNLATFRICGLPDPQNPGTECRVNNCEVCYSRTVCARCTKGYYWNTAVRDCEECRVKTDLVFVIDNSGSINNVDPNNYNILKDFVKSVVDSLDIGKDATRVAALRFATMTEIEFYLNTYPTKKNVKDAIAAIPYEKGGTRTRRALLRLQHEVLQENKGDRKDVRNVVILLTDGKTTGMSPIDVATDLKQDGVIFFVVAITNRIDEVELQEIASKPLSEHYYSTPSVKHLRTLKSTLIKYVCVDQDAPTGDCADPNGCGVPDI